MTSDLGSGHQAEGGGEEVQVEYGDKQRCGGRHPGACQQPVQAGEGEEGGEGCAPVRCACTRLKISGTLRATREGLIMLQRKLTFMIQKTGVLVCKLYVHLVSF